MAPDPESPQTLRPGGTPARSETLGAQPAESGRGSVEIVRRMRWIRSDSTFESPPGRSPLHLFQRRVPYRIPRRQARAQAPIGDVAVAVVGALREHSQHQLGQPIAMHSHARDPVHRAQPVTHRTHAAASGWGPHGARHEAHGRGSAQDTARGWARDPARAHRSRCMLGSVPDVRGRHRSDRRAAGLLGAARRLLANAMAPRRCSICTECPPTPTTGSARRSSPGNRHRLGGADCRGGIRE